MMLMIRRVLAGVASAIFFLAIFLVLIVNNKSNIFLKDGKRTKRSQPDDDCKNGGKWNEQTKICACTLGWIGNRCSVWHDHYCYFDNGKDYRGRLSVTKSGESCLFWTTDDNKRFPLGENGIGIHKFCRNPDNDDKGPWCFIGGANFTGYCNATRCSDSVKELLSRNASNVDGKDDTSAAVQFLFGPLISGVCAGVVVLLAFIVIAEYARRKKVYQKWKRSKKKNADKDSEKGEDDSSCQEEKSKENKLGEIEKMEIRPLGGIVTVDVDTGKKEVHTYQKKDLKKGSRKLQLLEQGSVNNAFVLQISDERTESPKKIRQITRTTNDIEKAKAYAKMKRRRRRTRQRRSELPCTSDSDSQIDEIRYSLPRRKRRLRSDGRIPPNELRLERPAGGTRSHCNQQMNENARTSHKKLSRDRKLRSRNPTDSSDKPLADVKTFKTPRSDPRRQEKYNEKGKRRSQNRSLSENPQKDSLKRSEQTATRHRSRENSTNHNAYSPASNDAARTEGIVEQQTQTRRRKRRSRKTGAKSSRKSHTVQDSSVGGFLENIPVSHNIETHANAFRDKTRNIASQVSDEDDISSNEPSNITPVTRRNSLNEPTTFL